MMALSGWICSSLSTRQRKLVTRLLPANTPPTSRSSLAARSTTAAADTPKQRSFQKVEA